MQTFVTGLAAFACVVLLSGAGNEASPSGSEALPAGFNDAVYYSVAIEHPEAQFVPQRISYRLDRQSPRSRS